MRDTFVLNNSTPITIGAQGNYPVSLDLIEAGDMPYQLSGTVKNTADDTPIENAYVGVYDSTGAFIAGDYTDINGEYAVALAAGTGYKAIASIEGYAPSDSFTFSISDQGVVHDFTLTAYSDVDRVIFGIITESVGSTAVEGARITVFDDLGAEVATTISILDGEYSAPYLSVGEFTMVVSKTGYSTQRIAVTITAGAPLVERDVVLEARNEPTGSSVSGYITEVDETAIANAWVGLYSSPDDMLQETTTTNADGYYCFEDVPAGSFVVKSKAVEQ